MFSSVTGKGKFFLFMNAIMYYKVRYPESVVTNVADYSGSSRLLAVVTVRNVFGT